MFYLKSTYEKKIGNIHVKRDINKQNHAQSQRNSHNNYYQWEANIILSHKLLGTIPYKCDSVGKEKYHEAAV